VDPGKRNLYMMMDDKGKFLVYRNRLRIHETKRIKYKNLLENYKIKNSMKEIEGELSNYNSKSCIVDKFKDYIKKKNSVNTRLKRKYQEGIFRKYTWYGYINRKRSEDNLLNKIGKTFGECTLIMGDWEVSKQMKNYISTPNISLKRKLGKKFLIYDLDEFRTSCLNYRTEDYCKNMYVHDKDGKSRRLHSVLTYQMENKRWGA
jgi:hypothetical protein